MYFIIFVVLIFGGWKLYEYMYFNGDKFITIKTKKEKYISDCNDLNKYIDELRDTHIGINQLDYGKSDYYDNSAWNYKRPELYKQRFAPNVCNCSRNVCDSSRKQPFKYICKYFNIKPTEETLSEFEKMLNNFESVESGKKLLKRQKEDILNEIKCDIPFLIRSLSKKKLIEKLGFKEIDLNTPYFPRFVFQYISSGGNSSLKNDVVLNISNLNRFVNYLSEIIKFKKSVAGQRALMTSALRAQILSRDNFTCQECGISKREEPHILLEIDHIIPLSKGGMTSEDNLQVLCWKCNRSKGNKIKDGTYVQKDIVDIPKIERKHGIIENHTEDDILENVIEEEKIEEIIIVAEEEKGDMENMKIKDGEKYPAGVYVVGDDIEKGNYLATPDNGGYMAIYKSYNDFLEQNITVSQLFLEDYHLSLKMDGMVVEIRDATFVKV